MDRRSSRVSSPRWCPEEMTDDGWRVCSPVSEGPLARKSLDVLDRSSLCRPNNGATLRFSDQTIFVVNNCFTAPRWLVRLRTLGNSAPIRQTQSRSSLVDVRLKVKVLLGADNRPKDAMDADGFREAANASVEESTLTVSPLGGDDIK